MQGSLSATFPFWKGGSKKGVGWRKNSHEISLINHHYWGSSWWRPCFFILVYDRLHSCGIPTWTCISLPISSLTFIAKLLDSTTYLHCLQVLSFHFHLNPFQSDFTPTCKWTFFLKSSPMTSTKPKGEFSVLILLARQRYWKQLIPSSFMLLFVLQNLQASVFVLLVSLASPSQPFSLGSLSLELPAFRPQLSLSLADLIESQSFKF